MDFNGPLVSTLRLDSLSGGQMVAKLLGFLRPPSDWQEMLNICISYCNATLYLSSTILANMSFPQGSNCSSIRWPDNITSNRVPIDFESHKTVSIGPYNSRQDEHSKMTLHHHTDKDDPLKVSSEILISLLFIIHCSNITLAVNLC